MLSNTIPAAPVDRNAADASGVEMPPHITIYGDCDEVLSIAFDAE